MIELPEAELEPMKFEGVDVTLAGEDQERLKRQIPSARIVEGSGRL